MHRQVLLISQTVQVARPRNGCDPHAFRPHSASFEAAISDAGEALVVVDAYAEWCERGSPFMTSAPPSNNTHNTPPRCGPCRDIAPVFDSLSREYQHVRVVKLDTERAPKGAAQLKIRVMPTFVFLKRGRQVGYVLGASARSLRQGLEADEKVGLWTQLCVVS